MSEKTLSEMIELLRRKSSKDSDFKPKLCEILEALEQRVARLTMVKKTEPALTNLIGGKDAPHTNIEANCSHPPCLTIQECIRKGICRHNYRETSPSPSPSRERLTPEALTTDVIGGFPYANDNCAGCGKKLLLENAWMTDGCPCNHPLGINSMNETRWRLLMRLQQEQADGCKYVPDAKAAEHHIRRIFEECGDGSGKLDAGWVMAVTTKALEALSEGIEPPPSEGRGET